MKGAGEPCEQQRMATSHQVMNWLAVCNLTAISNVVHEPYIRSEKWRLELGTKNVISKDYCALG